MIIKTIKLIWKRLPYIVIYAVAIYGLAFVGTKAYYRFMPATWFLNYYKAEVKDSNVGEDLIINLCRHKRYTNFRLEATRTYLIQKKDKNNDFQPIYNYTFRPTIEDGADCQDIILPTNRQPQEAGTYYIHTEADFFVNGNRKTIKYDTNRYKLRPTDKSLEDRIIELQKQINELRALMTPEARQIFDQRIGQAPPASSTSPASSGQATPNASSGTQNPSNQANPTPDNDGIITPTIPIPVLGIKVPSVHIGSPF